MDHCTLCESTERFNGYRMTDGSLDLLEIRDDLTWNTNALKKSQKSKWYVLGIIFLILLFIFT